MNHLSLIIKREYLNKVRNKSFIIMTFLSPLIFVGIFALVGYLSSINNDNIREISIVDNSGLIASNFKNTATEKFTVLDNITIEDAKIVASKGGTYGVLFIPKTTKLQDLASATTFYSKEAPSLSIIRDIENTIESHVNTAILEQANIDADKIKAMRIRVSTHQETFEGKETSKADAVAKLIFGGAAGYLLFMFIIIYGNMIMRSVIEEKTSRIIEIIISSVKPIKLLLGKIIGTSLAGVTQFVAWVILISILTSVVGIVFGIDTGAAQSEQQEMIASAGGGSADLITQAYQAYEGLPLTNLVIMFLLFFIGGYLLYASLYAAIGAAVDNETDTQQFMLPVLMPLILAVYVGFFTVIENPHGTVSQVFSYIPFTSPVVMLMRIPFGVPLWQQVLSVSILFVTFTGMVFFAAKIYRVGILMYGKKPTYKDLLKWLKY